MLFKVNDVNNAFICGAGHGIGLSLVKSILNQSIKVCVYATYRIKNKAQELILLQEQYPHRLYIYQVNPTIEKEVSAFFANLEKGKIKLDLVINSVGLLHDERNFPEKKLQDFSVEKSLEIFKVNTLVTPLLAKYFEKIIAKDIPSAFISISAKVGSIEDNRMGGWYSYRASKAALNMMSKNISIELTRKRHNCLVLAIHPGTTNTELSKPFIRNTPYKLHSAEQTALNILSVIDNKDTSETGGFLSWNQEELPW